MAKILVFGDSITYGVWDKEGGWTQRLRKYLDEKTLSSLFTVYHSVYNLGVSGNTTEDILERFEFETQQRIKELEKEELIIIFSIGINDSAFFSSQNNFWVLPEKFEINIKKLANFARKYSKKIIFVGLIPVDELKTNPIPWAIDISCKNNYIKRYNDIIQNNCKGNDVYFVEVFEKLVGTDYKNLLEDGLHPNSAGHQKIFEIVKDFLIKNKII